VRPFQLTWMKYTRIQGVWQPVNFFLPATKLRTIALYCQTQRILYNWPIRKQDWDAHGACPMDVDWKQRSAKVYIRIIFWKRKHRGGVRTFVSNPESNWKQMDLNQKLSRTNTKALAIIRTNTKRLQMTGVNSFLLRNPDEYWRTTAILVYNTLSLISYCEIVCD
jgi:hypothetical protein